LRSKALADGSMLAITNYGERSKGIEKMPLGLQIDRIGADGKLLKSYKIDYALLSEQTQVKTRNSPFGNEPVALHPVDVVETAAGIQVICESFYFEVVPINTGETTTTVASKEGFYHFLDLITVTLNNDNYSITNTAKPHRIVKLENIMVIGDGSAYEELTEDRAFSYQFSHGGKMYTKGWHKGFYYYAINNSLGEYEDLSSRVFFGKPILGAFDVRGTNALVVREPDFGNNHQLQHSGLMHFNSHFLVYEYRYGKMYYSIINY